MPILSRSLNTLLLCATLATAAHAGDAFFEKPLAELMTPQQFTEAGLGKLSPEELARLQQWLEAHTSARSEVVTKAAVAAEVKRTAEEQGVKLFETPSEARFEARIQGHFAGVRGKGQLLTLDNGQVWKITENVAARRLEVESPEVYLRASAIGSTYLMRLSGYGQSFRVERVK